MKQKRKKPERSDRLKYIKTKRGLNQGQARETLGRGSLPDKDDLVFPGMAEEISDETKKSANARRQVERYMEERALKEALADEIY